MGPPEEKEIIQKIKNGEIEYFSHIVKAYTLRIHGYVFKKLFEKADVDDIVQNAFLKLYKSIHTFNETRPVLPYLFEITKNELKMYYRSRKIMTPLNEKIVNEKEGFSFETEDVHELLKKLPEEQRNILHLVSEGYSYEEIAKKLGKPLNTVRTIIHRARLTVKKLQVL